jgi:hypothetical protein
MDNLPAAAKFLQPSPMRQRDDGRGSRTKFIFLRATQEFCGRLIESQIVE